MKKLLPIVEGHGDKQAVPILLRRILHHHNIFDVEVLHPHLRGDIPKIKSNFENFFKIALKENAAILWIIDFDCDSCICVAEESQQLYQRASVLYSGWPFKVAFMVKEFESIFLSDPNSTRSILKEIPETTIFPSEPEEIRGAKEWLSRAMPSGYSYKETIHQAKLANAVDLIHLKHNSSSYRHLEKSVLSLMADTNQQSQT